MDLRQKIQKDLQEALKNQEESRLSILRLVWDAVIKKEKEKRAGLSGKIEEKKINQESQLTDQELIQSLFTLVKRGKEAILQFKAGGRNDLAEKEQKEIEILQRYLPDQLEEEEIKKMSEQIIKETKAESLRDMGKVMAVLMPKIQAKADGDAVSKIVKELLSQRQAPLEIPRANGDHKQNVSLTGRVR